MNIREVNFIQRLTIVVVSVMALLKQGFGADEVLAGQEPVFLLLVGDAEIIFGVGQLFNLLLLALQIEQGSAVVALPEASYAPVQVIAEANSPLLFVGLNALIESS